MLTKDNNFDKTHRSPANTREHHSPQLLFLQDQQRPIKASVRLSSVWTWQQETLRRQVAPSQWHQWGLSGNLDLQLSPSSSRWLDRHFLCQSVASAETKLRAWTSALHPEVARGICLLLNYGVGVGFQNGGNHEFSQWNHMYNSIMTEAVTFAWHLFF